MEMLSQTRKEVVANLREQTAIKQSLMEIDDQNVKNKIEISKLQVNPLCAGVGVGVGVGV